MHTPDIYMHTPESWYLIKKEGCDDCSHCAYFYPSFEGPRPLKLICGTKDDTRKRLLGQKGSGREKAGKGLRRPAGRTTLCFIAASPFQAFTTLNGPTAYDEMDIWDVVFKSKICQLPVWGWSLVPDLNVWTLLFVVSSTRLTSNSAFSVQAKSNQNQEWKLDGTQFQLFKTILSPILSVGGKKWFSEEA